jgi:hypothetical protein
VRSYGGSAVNAYDSIEPSAHSAVPHVVQPSVTR